MATTSDGKRAQSPRRLLAGLAGAAGSRQRGRGKPEMLGRRNPRERVQDKGAQRRGPTGGREAAAGAHTGAKTRRGRPAAQEETVHGDAAPGPSSGGWRREPRQRRGR